MCREKHVENGEKRAKLESDEQFGAEVTEAAKGDQKTEENQPTGGRRMGGEHLQPKS